MRWNDETNPKSQEEDLIVKEVDIDFFEDNDFKSQNKSKNNK